MLTFNRFVSCFLFLLVVCSCSDKNNMDDTIPEANEDNELLSHFDNDKNINVIDNDTAYYSPVIDFSYSDYDYQISKKNEMFAIRELYNCSFGENFVFSPYNISLTYSIMINAADENVEQMLKDYMGIDDGISNEINSAYYQKTIGLLNGNSYSTDKKYMFQNGSFVSVDKLHITNKLWVKEHSYINKSFVSVLKRFSTDIKGVNFLLDNNEINSEAIEYSDNENASIDYSDYSSINSIMTNSIIFSQKWKDHYDRFYKQSFANMDKDSVRCTKFGFNGDANLYSCGFYYVIELPYKDEDYSMFVIYPCFTDMRFDNVLLDINNKGGLSYIIGDMKTTLVDFRMPEFCIKKSSPYTGGQKFDLGLSLSNVSNNAFCLNNVYQICSVKVDCDGTSAIASVPFPPGATETPPDPSLPEKPVELDVDRPFWFVIRNNKLSMIIFAGFVSNIL